MHSLHLTFVVFYSIFFFICGLDFFFKNLNSWKHTLLLRFDLSIVFFFQIFLFDVQKKCFYFAVKFYWTRNSKRQSFLSLRFSFVWRIYVLYVCAFIVSVAKPDSFFFHYLLHRDWMYNWIQIYFSSSYITLILYKNICIVLVFCVIWLFFYAFLTFSRICVNYIKRTGNFFVS